MYPILTNLQNKQLLWRARCTNHYEKKASSGFAVLDQALGGGLCEQGVVDVQCTFGIGELRLLLPYIQNLQKQHNDRLLVFIAPPIPVNSEMLAEQGFALDKVLIIQPGSLQHTLWAAEQCLKSGCCNAVLMWQQALEFHQVKRLQLAAKSGDTLQVVFRDKLHAQHALPVSLAMRLTSEAAGIQVTVTKRKGGWPSQPFTVNMRQQWPKLVSKAAASKVVPFPQRQVS